MNSWFTRHASRLAWPMVALYLFLMGVGLTLQAVAGSFFNDAWYGILSAIAQFVVVVVGALLVSRQPRHPVGWLFSFGALGAAIDEFSFGYAYYGLLFEPGSLPGADLVTIWLNWTGRALGAAGVALLFLWFPTGRPLSRRWERVGWTAIFAIMVYVITAGIASNPLFNFPFPVRTFVVDATVQRLIAPLVVGSSVLANLCAAAGIVSLFVRLGSARGIERQQLKWFVYAAALFPLGILLLFVSIALPESAPNWIAPLSTVILLLYQAGVAVASAIAILRFRLYDIDVIIHRTLVYGLLTAFLALIYFATVVLVQPIMQSLIGRETPLTIVGSTLLIAALFSPLRRRVQNFIDRRFYRSRYDAAQTLAQFARTARDEVELDALTAELIQVVEETMRPESVSIWLNERT